MRVLSIVGARPQFVKLAPIVRACQSAGVDHKTLHSGQHYDSNMSSEFFAEFDIPPPDIQLGAGGGTNVEQVAKISVAIQEHFKKNSYDAVLVYGDTNTTLAASLVVPRTSMVLAHVEAGLRSRNLQMPEELNRILTDHVSSLLFAPTHSAVENLSAEGLGDRTYLVGDVMYDVFKTWFQEAANHSQLPTNLPNSFYLATLHRASNVDNLDRLKSTLIAMNSLDYPVVLVVHPRLSKVLSSTSGMENFRNITRVAPLGHREILALLQRCKAAITDSGGLQKEAYFTETKCVTLREETEWPETLQGNCNVLSSPESLFKDVQSEANFCENNKPFGDGSAAVRIIDILKSKLNR